jgi:hypothetical protein
MNYKKIIFISALFTALYTHPALCQDEDAFFIKSIYDEVLENGDCYLWLTHLSSEIGHRLAGSDGSYKAVDYTESILKEIGAEKVWRQECMVPHWERGEIKELNLIFENGELWVPNSIALGNSVGTDGNFVRGEIIEVFSLDEVAELGREKIEGKVVFYNRPMDPKQLNTFRAYGGAVDQRGSGPSVASEYGAKAVIVRSMTTRHDDVPHTGSLRYSDKAPAIPAMAISTNDANRLSKILQESTVRAEMKLNCEMMADTMSYNVIGEIKGSEFPDEIILVGGHLDSWDVGGGAHDDGSGCVHSLQVFQVLKKLNYKPKRTLRCVMFMNEENGLGGAKAYAKISIDKGEYHLAAIESDRGGFTPRGFTCDGDPEVYTNLFRGLYEFLPLIEPYDLFLTKGGSGADINPLKSQKGLLIGLSPDTQRYFDFHHTAADTIDAVNERELKMGAAAMASLVYLIDKYGLKE